MQKQGLLYFDIWRADLGVMLEKFQTWRSNTTHYFFKGLMNPRRVTREGGATGAPPTAGRATAPSHRHPIEHSGTPGIPNKSVV